MRTRWIILGALLLFAISAIVGYYALGNSNGSAAQGSSSTLPSIGQLASDPNFFAGNVTTSGVPPGTYNGIGVYDQNCLPIGNGMFSCDAGIQTRSHGIIDFSYRHNMMMKPCIGPGDALTVTVLNNRGAATVRRTSSGSSGYT